MAVHLCGYKAAELDEILTHANALKPAHSDTYHTGSSKRGGALGVAGIDGSKIELSEHQPVCLHEYYISGQSLQVTGFIDTDIWSIITDSPTSNTYASRVLTLKSGTLAITAARAMIPYPNALSCRAIEVTFGYGGCVNGVEGARNNFLGFASSLSAFPIDQRLGFSRDNATDISYIVYGGVTGQSVAINTLPLGRNVQATDYLTVRLETREGSIAPDIARFYINGIKQFETTSIPTLALYVGCGVYNVDEFVTTQSEMSITYFGFKKFV